MSHRFLIAFCITIWTSLAHAETPACPGPSHIVMASGSFSTRPGVQFELKHFRAQLTPMSKIAPSCFEHFTDVSRGEIFVSNESITELFSAKLAQTDSKITDLKIVHGADGVTISGKLKKMIPVYFSIAGPVSTNGSEIRMEAKTIKAEGIPVKSLMSLVGEHLNAMLQLKNAKGITVGDDSLAFSPEAVAHLRGHIASVTPSAAGLTLQYDGKAAHGTTGSGQHS